MGPDDELFVSELHPIRRIAPDGAVSTLAGTGEAGFANGTGDQARFNTPTGLALKADGTLFAADTTNQRIRPITPTGTVSTLVGDGTPAQTNGPVASAQVNQPISLALDGTTVRLITPPGY